VKQQPSRTPSPPPLFAHAINQEIVALEAERERLKAVVNRMREQRDYGAVQRLETRLHKLTAQIFAIAFGKGTSA
jgi:hypothetical protein